MRRLVIMIVCLSCLAPLQARSLRVARPDKSETAVSSEVMRAVYEEVKTPYKYGMVLAPADNHHKMDCPTVFRAQGKWYMSYLVYDGKTGKDGRGYETWLAESEDLLHWTTLGRLLPFSGQGWDANQRAGYMALEDMEWGGSYRLGKYDGKYWMSYFGGAKTGYEGTPLSIGMACTEGKPTEAHPWQCFDQPALAPSDADAQWFETITQYKSTVFRDKKENRFVMFYNAAGINPDNQVKAERIGMAYSTDMMHWERYPGNPVFGHENGMITGDAHIQKMGDLYVMFFFGAFWKNRPYDAFNTFACSYDLTHWTEWDGEDLIYPTEDYENWFAHKSYLIKYKGVVYHFYCAVNHDEQRGIAVATSKDMGHSDLHFPAPDPKASQAKRIPSAPSQGRSAFQRPSVMTPKARTAAETPDWENQRVLEINRMPARGGFMPYAEQAGDRSLTLNGLWKFNWVPRPEEAPAGFFQTGYDDSQWVDFKVPANWEVNGYGTPVYISAGFPFKINPPFVTDEPNRQNTTYVERNPVGSYRRTFDLPAGWENKEVFLRFDGVQSAFYVWINGEKVGYSQGSMEMSEFDVTPYLHPGSNLIALQVFKYCDGSYLEDQDMWRFGGIHRDVTLYATPKVRLYDFGVRTELSDNYTRACLLIEPQLKSFDAVALDHLCVEARLYDAEGREVLSEVLRRDAESVLNPNYSSGILNDRTPQRGPHSFGWLQAEIEHPALWTAETPNLYTLRLCLCDTLSGEVWEQAECKVGFREVRIDGPQLLVNGKPVRLRGVNRHEHDPATAKVMSEERMLQDIKLMKRANVNAVRLSHYPDCPRWYELCDEYGLYLLDEANIESHGVRGYLASEPSWAPAFMDRTVRMALRDRNHPSIIGWSLGNESGFGFNFAATAAWLHDFDPTRFVHYEGAQGNPLDPSSVDVIARFYPRTQDEYVNPNIPEGEDRERAENARWDRLLSMARDRSNGDRPVMTSEYAHCMGNALGNFKEYWDEIYSDPRMLGGFIWDWVDQGVYKTLPDGQIQVAYGGDFGDRPNSKAFCLNGVILCDRSLTPKYDEVRKVYQPFLIERLGESMDIRLTNRQHHVGTSAYRLYWDIGHEGKVIEKGSLELPETEPSASCLLSIPASKYLKYKGNLYLTVHIALKEATPWAEAGYDIAWEQFCLSRQLPKSEIVPGGTLRWEENQAVLTVSGKQFSQRWNLQTASLESFLYKGREYLGHESDQVAEPWFQAFRAATDNDAGFGNWLAKDWKNNGLAHPDRQVLRADYQRDDQGRLNLVFVTLHQYLNGSITATDHYVVSADGSIEVESRYECEGELPVLPRLGCVWTFSGDFSRLNWFGYGPQETYPDRCSGARISQWSETVSPEFRFPRPQECGNHEAVQHFSLTDAKGRGVRVTALDETFSFSALRYTAQDLDAAQHPEELQPRSSVICSIDAQQLGLGNSSCGPGVLAKYLVTRDRLHYRIYPQ